MIFFQQSFTPEQRKAFEEKLVSDCAKKEGATAEDLAGIAKHVMPTTPTGKCMHACFIETLGFVSMMHIKIKSRNFSIMSIVSQAKDNKVIVDGVVEMAKLAFDGDASKVQTAREIGGECAGVIDSDRCEFAIKMMGCAITATKNRNINISEWF